jgi:hypothetical protein
MMPPVLAVLGLAVLGLADWVALDVVTTWLPQPAAKVAAPAVAAMSIPARVRRPGRVTGTPMVISPFLFMPPGTRPEMNVSRALSGGLDRSVP